MCYLSKTKSGYGVRKHNKKMSYTIFKEIFHEALRPHVNDIGKFALHSLRSGGASAAANNGAKNRMFQ